MDAILRINDEARLRTLDLVSIYDLINSRRAIEPGRFAVAGEIIANRRRGIAQLEMDRLILLVIGIGEEDR